MNRRSSHWTPTYWVVLISAAAVAAGASLTRAADYKSDEVYLFTSFRANGEDGLRFVYSLDGYHWTNVPGTFLTPHVGPSKLMRDPSLLRGPDGMFHLVWTTGWRGDQGFGYSTSKDLVHWLEQRFIPVMEHEPTTVNVWAPELYYDANNERFIICWASTIPGRFPENGEPRDNNQRMYYTTTKDFQSFAPTKLFLDPNFNVIDCTIVKDGDRYVLVLKDNSRDTFNLRVAEADDPLGPWRNISPPFTAKFTEGPTVLKLGNEWLVYFDAYRAGIYGASKTRDFKTFTDVTPEVSFPPGHKHGTVIRISRKELAYLLRVGSEQIEGVRLPFSTPLPADQIAERLREIDEVAERGPFRPHWESLGEFKTPKWYADAKFGLFIHWGPYCVPAFGSEWYPRNMYMKGTQEFEHHVKTFGQQSAFGYKDFIPQFTAEKFDPDAWAALFKEAGVKYVIPVAEHHDGFPMYASDFTEWSAAKKGPRRDVIGDLAAAARKQDIVVGASSHRAEHWFFFEGGMLFDSDVIDPANASLYGPAVNKRVSENQSEPPDKAFLDDWLLRSCEIVDKYKPEVMYFDWWICQPVFQPYLKRFGAYYYNRAAEWGKDVAINFKDWEGRSFPDGTGVFDIERGQSAEIRPELWQTCTSVSKNSWGYVSNHDYKDVSQIIGDLVDIVSKNGTMLLNIGPKADGTIPDHEQDMLRQIGAWLAVNGEAIYGTRPWHVSGEGPTKMAGGSFTDKNSVNYTGEDFRFTTKGDALYAIALSWPTNGKALVKSLADKPMDNVQLLGYDGNLAWKVTQEGLEITVPSAPPSEFGAAFKIIAPQLMSNNPTKP